MMKYLLFALFAILSSSLNAQQEFNRIALGISYGFDTPLGDLKDRFGSNYHIGISLGQISNNKKLSYYISAGAIFGSTVKEDVLASYRNNLGLIPGIKNNQAEVYLKERGLRVGVGLSKNIYKIKKYGNVFFGIEGGIIQHNIHFNDSSGSVPYVQTEYKSGYDRNTRGPYLAEFLGYRYMKNQLNFEVSTYTYFGFTKNTRTVNYDLMAANNEKRLDILLGIKVAWFLPFVKVEAEGEDIFY